MTELTLLERKRKALINAKLDALQKKHGCHSVIVKVGRTNYRLDLDEEILNLALIELFEKDTLAVGGEKILIDSYSNFYTKHGNLTIEGDAFMEVILEHIAQKTEPIK
ncbi:hypothetical protein Xsto_04172 [Xenorhabdus stockiae]|uniref:Uncharacterized protein n=1 Tax=Xenorhabdus stockiae TaxID=351614 RepID=A0A2D0K1L7_9GAMM|nr:MULTISPECIES: hypothetical protein [Xenorhabdus]PHM54453.1 hypothetical protein Xsto_04172 [Xenorhabdus stockiae]PHM68447.1 hypothetical protein Xekj_03267 [Xenorhabdus sp. KJ12.1]